MYVPTEVLSIKESSGVFSDAILCDEAGTLMFLSLWGHDTAIKELIARLSLPLKEGGINAFNVGNDTRKDRLVSLGNIERLDKLSGKTGENTVFGGLSHMWIYDGICEKPDFVNSRAVMLCFPSEDEKIISNRLWQLVKKLCHLPLRDHWRDKILCLLREGKLIKELPGIGLNGMLLHLDKEIMETSISGMIQKKYLCLNEKDPAVEIDAECSLLEFFGDNIVSSYSRANMLEDGFLIDLSDEARENGFAVPVAITKPAWVKCVAVLDSEIETPGRPEEIERLQIVLRSAYMAAREAQRNVSVIYFTVNFPFRQNIENAPTSMELKSHIGPGDEGEPVITLMLPDED